MVDRLKNNMRHSIFILSSKCILHAVFSIIFWNQYLCILACLFRLLSLKKVLEQTLHFGFTDTVRFLLAWPWRSKTIRLPDQNLQPANEHLKTWIPGGHILWTLFNDSWTWCFGANKNVSIRPHIKRRNPSKASNI